MKINENGIEAAALAECTATIGCALYEPLENISFDIDRPFLFAVTGTDNSVLMSGVVNDPKSEREENAEKITLTA